MQFTYHIPTKILFGAGQLSNLHKEKLPGSCALIITTNGKSVRKYGYFDRLTKELETAGVKYFSYENVSPNPTLENVNEAVKIAKDNGCDFVIGFGGGSAIDCAKAVAIMMENDGELWDYFVGGSGKGKIPQKCAPIVAITTTAGTGTEADLWFVITKTDTNEKIGMGFSPLTYPVLSIVDAELMLSVPPHFTAYQGFDALFHATEGYLSKFATPVSEAYGLKSIELLGKYLPLAVKNGSDIEAREKVAAANTLSGMSESVCGCISEHSLEHALSAYHPELPHGKGLIMISEAYYSYFADKDCVKEKMINMARALGKRDANKAEDFVTALVELQKACNVYGLKMSDYGIKKDELVKYARNAIENCGSGFACDPYPLTEADAVSIYERAYK